MSRRWFPSTTGGAPTRLAGLPRARAAAVLVALAVLLGWGLVTSFTLPNWVFGTASIPDLDLYREVVTRVHGGEHYYDFLADALGRRDYPVGSTFNWRLPTCAWLLGALPDPSAGRWLLFALALVSVVTAAHVMLDREAGPVGTVVGVVLLFGGAFGWGIYEPDTYLSTEPWCEALLLLSLSAYAAGRWPLGVGSALAALLLRELVLPYCVVAAALAWWHGRRAELRAWAVGLAVFAVLYAWHASVVARHNAGTVPSPSAWLDPQGLRFILRSGALNVWVRGLPTWAAAVYLTAAVAGLAGWRGETGARLALTAAAYLVPLVVVRGWEYWGFLYTPLLILGLVRAPAAVRDLVCALRRPFAAHPTVA
jgi:hypothetical protein